MSSTDQTPGSVLKEDPLSIVLRRIDELIKGKLVYPPRITKYELARLVAARAKQLAMGARPMIDPQKLGTYDPVLIAYEEVRRGLIPFVIIRTLPNGRQVRIKLKDLLDLSREFGVQV
ncbi:MAG: DNA-directed RNA polymerase subunit K [Vulcanisaeta sp.]|jgi:DNA-directed RNA polymerase subunit K|nr:DNA-directed RNA polymerase subunit K [Vulcanisaeta sp.]MCG2869170.1 DNA-directed RNA polymerase subunit K [Vulcanisaeta sp.]MCG2879825.1 DNA-directed RNA polymerase subunit K [Vulcanisaeta sp.]MCG2886531.1 DNA-directed RNA polymerase subunit K [Vulcanisaeta sp.]